MVISEQNVRLETLIDEVQRVGGIRGLLSGMEMLVVASSEGLASSQVAIGGAFIALKEAVLEFFEDRLMDAALDFPS